METTSYLRRRAQQGDADALFRLGYRLAFGRRRPRPTDWAAVVDLWQRAAARNHRRAQFYLGTCYDRGKGVTQDLRQAMRWYRAAAENGLPEAQYNLAFGYREGIGVLQDLGAAVYWFTQAAEAGDPGAQRDLGYCYHEGVGTVVDYEAAARWYRRAAKAGDAKAQFNLGLCYLDGDGVPPSRRWAVFWLTRAAEQGHRRAKAKIKEFATEPSAAADGGAMMAFLDTSSSSPASLLSLSVRRARRGPR
jgi:TPR repeat protein